MQPARDVGQAAGPPAPHPEQAQAAANPRAAMNPPADRLTRSMSSFHQLYGDDSKDPCQGSYQRIMERYDASRAGAIPGNTLYQQVVSLGGSVPQAYLCCSNTLTGARIYCVHSPNKFVGNLDGTPTPWDNLSFAFLGEVVHSLVSFVLFPEDAFDLIQVRTRTLPYIIEHQEELTDLAVFPPVLPAEVDSEEVLTRRFMALPAAYVPLLLNSRGYTAKQAWDLLYPAVTHRQELEICAPLIKWLQAASTGTARLNPLEIGEPALAIVLQSPPADDLLLTHQHNLLNQVLPGLKAPPQSLEAALTQMATAIVAQTNDSRIAREYKEAIALEPKLPSDRFTVTLPVLMEYLQIDDERNLPTIWHSWANCSKRQESQVLRDALDAYARSEDAYSSTVPIITARLTQDLLAFNFVGQSVDDLKNGLHPFITSTGNAEHRQTNQEVARLYGLLTAGDATCSLSDLETLAAKEARSVPVTYWELETCLGVFGNLIGVVLGSLHPLAMAYRSMWTLMRSSIREDLHAALEYRSYVKPTHLLRSIQLEFYTWFTHRRARLTPPTPDLTAIVHQIMRQVYVLPTLPPQLYHLVYPKKATTSVPWATPGSGTSVPGSIATGSSNSSATSSGNSFASTVSGLSTPSGITGLVQSGRGARIANLHPIAALTNLIPTTTKLKDVIGTSTPPILDNGAEMCLSFLLRQGCWSNCRRAQQHTSTLSQNEQARLSAYLTQRLRSSPSIGAQTTAGTGPSPTAGPTPTP
jgi:hypothetical protein